ncbi:MAG: Formate dehydrogenase O alpha subunit, partial [uncultured Solirubrobacteraceae bacterium]
GQVRPLELDVRGRRPRPGRRRRRAGDPGVHGPHGRPGRLRRPARRDAPAPAVRLPGHAPPLLALHARDGRAAVRHPARALPRGRRHADRELGARPHDDARLRRRLDPAHRRRADHPRGGDRPAPARQRRPPGRRHHGDARARVHPGLERHPDALRDPPGLPPDAAREGGGPHARGLHRDRRPQEGVVVALRQVHGLAAEGLVRRGRDGGERLRLLAPAEADRQPLALPDDAAGVRRRARRPLRDGAEPGGRLDPLRPAAPRARPHEVARGARPRRPRDGALLEGLARDPLRRGEDGGHRHGGLPDARRRARGEGGPLHEHAAAAAVARQGDRPAGRRPLGAVVRLPPRPPDQGPLRGLRARAGLADPEPDVGLPRARRRAGAECGGGAQGDQRLRPDHGRARRRLRAAQGRRHDLLRLLDLLRVLRGRRQPDPPPRAGRPLRARRLRLARVGLGVAREPARPLQPGVRRPRGQAVVGAQEARLVGRGEREVGGLRRPRLPARQATRVPARRPRGGDGRDPGRRPVHDDARRPRTPLQRQRAARRAAADALRAARVARPQRPLSARRREPGGDHVGSRREPDRGTAGRALPARGVDLPAHGAPHRRPDEPQPPVARRAAARDVRGDRPGARRVEGDRRRRVDGRRDAARGDRGAREGHEPRQAAADRRRRAAPDLPAVALRHLRLDGAGGHGRRGERPRGDVGRPERDDPRVQGVPLRGARGPALGRDDGAPRGSRHVVARRGGERGSSRREPRARGRDGPGHLRLRRREPGAI